MHAPTLCTLILIGLAASAVAQQTPTPAAAAWWQETTALANDSMEGRDTGTEAYGRAAKYVAAKFAKAGLKTAGDNGTFLQRVPMHQVDLDTAHSSVAVEIASGDSAVDVIVKLLQEATLQPNERLPLNVRAAMKFIGYGLDTSTDAPKDDNKGMVLVYFAGIPSNLPAADRQSFASHRAQQLSTSGAVATVAILNPNDIEPFHWPAAYARSVTLAGTPFSANPSPRCASAPPPLQRCSATPAPTSPQSCATANAAPRYPPWTSTPSSASTSKPPQKTSPPPTSSPYSPVQTPLSQPSTSPSPPTSTATATAPPSTETISTTAHSTTPRTSPPCSSSPAHKQRSRPGNAPGARCSSASSPVRRKACSARPGSPSTQPSPSRRSSRTSTSTSSVPSSPSKYSLWRASRTPRSATRRAPSP